MRIRANLLAYFRVFAANVETPPRISANLRELRVFAYLPYIRVYPRISAVYPPYIHVYWSAYRPRICRIFAANLCEIYAYSRMELVTAATSRTPLYAQVRVAARGTRASRSSLARVIFE